MKNMNSVFASLKQEAKTPLDKKIFSTAWEIQKRSVKDSRKPLSLNKEFYVYALLDPRAPGPYEYEVEGKLISFEYQPFYIGKGKGDRVRCHSRYAEDNPQIKKREPRYNLIRKLHRMGLQPIELVLSRLSVEAVAFAKELILISSIGRRTTSNGPLTNLSVGGEGSAGSTRPKEWIEMIKQVNRDRTRTVEEREKLSKSLTGRKFSEQHISNLCKAARSRERFPHSEETKRKMSKAQTGKSLSEETRKKMSEAAKRRVRSPHSLETLEKMRAAALGRKHTEATKEKLRAANLGKRRS